MRALGAPIADEAHSSQYDFTDGYARYMRDALPHASFVGFTGTPIEKTDANTRGVRRLHQRLRQPARRVSDSAVKVLGEPTLVNIARVLVETVKENVTIDWTVRENVRAQLRVLVKRILRKYGYPPDKQERATQTVLERAALLSEAWSVA
jgi:type I site-specific restriction-modification system R (restriction) subunit